MQIKGNTSCQNMSFHELGVANKIYQLQFDRSGKAEAIPDLCVVRYTIAIAFG